ncbi:MAG: HDOD domain-containing protein [Deltaproteobacteria bacterium]|nr:HDOD domain-containing protein [Deltaproteobacteria bacterium]
MGTGIKSWLRGFVERALTLAPANSPEESTQVFRDEILKELSVHDPRIGARLQKLLDDLEEGRIKPPMLPQVALELLQKASSENVSFDEVAKLAVSDPSVAARIMKLAQSPGMGSVPPKGVKDALVRLGIFGIREVAFDIAFSSKALRKGPHMALAERTIRHARSSSALSRLLARDVKVHPGVAALAGLVHALGGLLLIEQLTSQRNAAGSTVEVPGFLLYLCIHRLHPKVTALACKQYSLDEAIQNAMANHHGNLADASSLTQLLYFSDVISPGEPGARVTPLAQALTRSHLDVDEVQVRERLLPLTASFEELRLSMEATPHDVNSAN